MEINFHKPYLAIVQLIKRMGKKRKNNNKKHNFVNDSFSFNEYYCVLLNLILLTDHSAPQRLPNEIYFQCLKL